MLLSISEDVSAANDGWVHDMFGWILKTKWDISKVLDAYGKKKAREVRRK